VISTRRRALIGAVCLLAVLLGAPSAFAVSWPQFRYSPAHTGFNPFERTLGPTNVARLTTVCSAGIDGTPWASPAVVNGRVYTVAYDEVYAVAARTCAIVWSAKMDGYSQGSPAVAGGLLYVCSAGRRPEEPSTLHAFDAATGATVWTAPVAGDAFCSPAVAEGRVFVGTSDGGLHALDAATGATLWQKGQSGTTAAGTPQAAVARGVVYIAGGSAVKAFRASSGRQLWTARFRGYFPAVGDGRVYVSTLDGNLVALDAVTGAIRWNVRVGGGLPSGAALAYGRVYVHSLDRTLHALDAETGRTIWSAPIGDPRASIYGNDWGAAPVVANGVAYVVPDEETIEALDAATGERLWQGRLDHPWNPRVSRVSPAVVNGRVYVGSWSRGVGLVAFGLPTP